MSIVCLAYVAHIVWWASTLIVLGLVAFIDCFIFYLLDCFEVVYVA